MGEEMLTNKQIKQKIQERIRAKKAENLEIRRKLIEQGIDPDKPVEPIVTHEIGFCNYKDIKPKGKKIETVKSDQTIFAGMNIGPYGINPGYGSLPLEEMLSIAKE